MEGHGERARGEMADPRFDCVGPDAKDIHSALGGGSRERWEGVREGI